MDGGTINGEVFEICANIDDMTGEDLGEQCSPLQERFDTLLQP